MLRRLAQPSARRHVALAALCTGLTALPLIGTLGYENAFVLAPVLSGFAMFAGVDAVRTARQQPAHGRREVLLEGLREVATLDLVALGVMVLGRLWQPGCDPWGGLLFFVAGPLLSSFLGWSCGIWAGCLSARRGRAIALAFAPFVVCLAIGLWRLYAHPVVFAYDPFWGYFSGSIYDESITVGERYWSYRAYNAWVCATAWLAWSTLFEWPAKRWRWPAPSAGSRGRLAAVAFGVLGSLWVGTQADRLGFSATVRSITEKLSGTYETEHFVIHYPPRSPYALVIGALATDHEFAWTQLRAQLGREPHTRVHSFLFLDADQKRSLMGAGSVQVAAPWRYQIYLDHRGFPHEVLPHELAHIFGATVGDRLLGISRRGLAPNMGLIEGFATALAPRASGRLDLHDQAKVLDTLEHRPAMSTVMGAGFLAQASRVAYITAGSFCRYLIDTRGIEPMAKVYESGGDFMAAYDTSLATLEAEWLAFIRAYPGVRPQDVAMQAEQFQRRSVFRRPCAHAVAEIQSAIRRARSRGELEQAIAHHKTLCALEPEEPAHEIGFATALAEAGRLSEAAGVLAEAALREDTTSTIRARIAEREGDVALVAGEPDRALAAYDRALAEPISEDERRLLLLKRLAATDSSLRDPLLAYFALFDPLQALLAPTKQVFVASQIHDRPASRALGSYLLGRQMLNLSDGEAALTGLRDAIAQSDALPDPAFVRAARVAAMTAALLAGDLETASAQQALLAADPQGNGDRQELDLWRARIEYWRQGALP